MSYQTDPHEIGKRESPDIGEGAEAMKDTDQRWFTEVQSEFPSDGDIWTGEGYQTKKAVCTRLAHRFMENVINRGASRAMKGGFNVKR